MSDRERIRARLAAERGTLYSQGRRRLSLVYPSPYAVGMSSLGFQSIYGRLNRLPDTAAERAFLPEPEASVRQLLTYESQRPAQDAAAVAFSVAYEIELAGVFECLRLMSLPALAAERDASHPLVIMGGPLTFSNPLPLGPFADVVVLGEAEQLLEPLVELSFAGLPRPQLLDRLAQVPGLWVPALHGEALPPIAQCDDAELPALSHILTAEATLSDMFLIEPERGCSRGCTFCVMRRSTNGGMRLVSPERVLASIPSAARRVGLVGAAVTDHPRIKDILRGVVEGGRQVGISSLRANRLDAEFVELLVRGGYRTLTVASDGASERLRDDMEKRIRQKHMLRAAELGRDAGVGVFKVYMMLGVPGETPADIDTLVQETLEQLAVAKPARLVLGVSTFVAKRNTPLDGLPFVGVRQAEARLAQLRQALKGRVEVRPTSPRWAHIEYELAQGGMAAGLAAHRAWLGGGRYADYRRELEAIAAAQHAYRDSRRSAAQALVRRRPLRVLGSATPAHAASA